MKVAATIREPYTRALGLVGAAHFMSHFSSMTLPPLIPFLHQELGVSYTVLGVLLSAKKITSGATGKVFGFVFSGQSFGGGIAPVVYGFMLDMGNPSWILFTSAAFMILCMIAVLQSGRARRAAAAVSERAAAE